MEPLSALGIASAVVTFLDFSGDLIQRANEVYHAADGTTLTKKHSLEIIIKDLNQLCDRLVITQGDLDRHARSDCKADLVPLIKSRRSLGQEFLVVLENLNVQGQRKR